MDRRRLIWVTAFVTALVAVIGLAWTFAVPDGSTAAAPGSGPSADAEGGSPDSSAPAGPSLTVDAEDDEDRSTTEYDPGTTLARTPDTDEGPVPLAATGTRPGTTTSRPTTGPNSTPSITLDSCIDPATGNTARCVTTTTGGTLPPGSCDTSVGRTTVPGCPPGGGGTTTPPNPCATSTTQGCPGGGGTTTAVATSAPTTLPPATAPPVTCYPVACPDTTRAAAT